MRKINFLTLNALGLLMILFGTSSPFAQIAQPKHPSKPDLITVYNQVLDIIFPRNEGGFNQKGKGIKAFSLAIRFKPTSAPESQINIDKYTYGKIEVTMFTAANKKKVFSQVRDLANQMGSEDASVFSELIKIEKKEIKKPQRVIEQLLDQYTALRFSPAFDTALYLDGTEYELWYETVSNSVHFSLSGPDSGSSLSNDPIIKWMNEVLQTVQ